MLFQSYVGDVGEDTEVFLWLCHLDVHESWAEDGGDECRQATPYSTVCRLLVKHFFPTCE